MFELMPNLDRTKETPLYIQLYEFIKQQIRNGSLKESMKIPSKRKLSDQLEVSINTVEAAYQQLMAEGYLESRLRKGLFVNKLEGDFFTQEPTVPLYKRKRDLTLTDDMIDFNHGKIDLANFPYSAWKKTSLQTLDESHRLLQIGDPQGEAELREAIVRYLFQTRAVHCSKDQIVIGAGTQCLIELLCLLAGDKQTFAMEDPGYHRVRQVLLNSKAIVEFVPVDEDGIVISQLKEKKADYTYVTPSHQFPNGTVMPITRRLELLSWAEKSRGYIIEDDYDGEFRHMGKPIPSLQGLDKNGRVVYLGTFSKSLIPSIRLNYMILPPSLAKKYHENFTIYKQTVSRFTQHTVYLFIKNGHWERHLNRMRQIYKQKHHVLMGAIIEHFGDEATVIGEKSGLHILMKVNNRMSEAELIDAALTNKVRVYPTSIYYAHPGNGAPMVLIGYGGLSDQEIGEGIKLLKKAWLID